MKFLRPRLVAALGPAAIGVAGALVAAAVLAGPNAGRADAPAHVPGTLTALVTAGPAPDPVLVNCLNRDQVRPTQFVLTCADALSELIHLNWQAWGSSGYATGTWWVDDCVPSCVQGKISQYPALVVVWRPRPLPGHPGRQYLTRLAMLLPGAHCFTAQGKRYCYPVNETTDLWSSTT